MNSEDNSRQDTIFEISILLFFSGKFKSTF